MDSTDNYFESPVKENSIHPFNGNLTLIPTPHLVGYAKAIQKIIRTDEKFIPRRVVHLVEPQLGNYINTEPSAPMKKDKVVHNDCIILTTGPGNHQMTGEVTDTLYMTKARQAGRITVFTPYLPRSRSDHNEGNHTLAMLPVPIITWLAVTNNDLNRIITFDCHAELDGYNVIKPGLFYELSLMRRTVKAALEIALKITDKITILFPDGSSAKRYGEVIKRLERDNKCSFPKIFCEKDRFSSKKVKIIGFYGFTEAVKDSLILSLDDEIATGGTNILTAHIAKKKYQARYVWSITTHPVFCPEYEAQIKETNFPYCHQLLAEDSPIDQIICADTIPINNRPIPKSLIAQGKLKIIECCIRDMAWICYILHLNGDVRRLR